MKRVFFFLLVLLSVISGFDQDYEVEFKSISDLQKLGNISEIRRGSGKGKVIVTLLPEELERVIPLAKKITLIPRNTQGHVMAHTLAEWKENWPCYPDYSVYLSILDSLAAAYRLITELDTFGYSYDNRLLLSLTITGEHIKENKKPGVFFFSGIHGNETSSVIVALKLIEYLCSNYGKDSVVTDLIDDRKIKIFPLLNPDGMYYAGNETVTGAVRRNLQGMDLNRSFPDHYVDDDPDTTGRAKETQAVMRTIANDPGHISISYHSGALVVNYPWDGLPDGRSASGIVHNAPDSLWFIKTAKDYARLNEMIYYEGGFPEGVTNGVDWYTAYGTLQDWLYYYHQNFQFTIEINERQNPPASELPRIWESNFLSIMNFLDNSGKCIQGLVLSDDASPVQCEIILNQIPETPVKSDTNTGFFVRFLPEGEYDLIFSSSLYEMRTVSGVFDWNDPLYYVLFLTPKTKIEEIDTEERNKIRVFPNPFHDELNLIIGSGYYKEIELYNILGEIVLRQRMTEDSKQVIRDVSQIPAGIYFLTCKGEKGTRTVKLIKE